MNCKTNGCKKEVSQGTYCHACRKARWRNAYKFRAAYVALKDNAKRRGKYFDLTFEQFSRFAIETKYFYNKGRSSTSLHIDRIEENKGYTLSNIQVLTNAENSYKYRKFKERTEHGITFETCVSRPVLQNDCPF